MAKKKLVFRNLKASEIECRIGSYQKDSNGNPKSFDILLYKDARVDYKLLDEVVGCLNWQVDYARDPKGGLMCTVSVYDEESGQWVRKTNVGTESNTEATKGEYSDALKRACFALGIGRELYTAPRIKLNITQTDTKYTKYYVAHIAYDENNTISELVIERENYGNGIRSVAYTYGAPAQQPCNAPQAPQTPVDGVLNSLLGKISAADKISVLTQIYNENPSYQSNPVFMSALTNKKVEIQNRAA